MEQEIQKLKEHIKLLESAATIPHNVEQAFRTRFRLDNVARNLPPELSDAPLALIADPTGGLNVDTEARAVIATLIQRLEALGLILPN